MNVVDNDKLSETLREELQIFESIYPDYLLDYSDGNVRLEVPVELGISRQVVLVADRYSLSSSNTSTRPSMLKLAYLPPILLNVKIPPNYPHESPPIITSVYATHSWLPQEAQVAQVLRQTWTKGEGVLCNWVELVRSGEVLDQLRLVDRSGVIRLPETQPNLSQQLLAYDTSAALAVFSQNSFSCSICFTSLKGSRCVQLSCSHVFCRPCLQEYWGYCIAEGSIERVGCADPGCVKVGREAVEAEVRRVVSEKEVVRWKWLKTKKAIEKDPTIVHCQDPVPKPPSDPSQSSGWDRFRSCMSCGFHFCSFCKHTWHGPISECSKSVTHAIVMEYLDLPEGSPERAALERKFGKGVVLGLVKKYEEEKSTSEWLEASTTACPGCHVKVEKSVGCNHMMCAKCQQHFCYRCGTRINALEPYIHFSTKGSGCYGKLFDFKPPDREWQPVEGYDLL